MIAGVDVSSQNGTVNWRAIASAGYGFAYIKASEGDTDRDPSFQDNWGRSHVAGLVSGAYHYARPTPGSTGEEQAAWFTEALQTVGAAGAGHLPPALILATSSGLEPAAVQAWAQAFVAELRRRTGRVPMIYAGRFWTKTLGNPPDSWGCPLWLAYYQAPSQVPAAWSGWTLWQHTSTGNVEGITDTVFGLSVFDGSNEDLIGLTIAGAGEPRV